MLYLSQTFSTYTIITQRKYIIILLMPSGFFINPAAELTLLLMLVGLVGAVVPIIPGPPLIWLGALAWAYGENFRHVDWITLVVLGVIALVATFAEVWLTPLM